MGGPADVVRCLLTALFALVASHAVLHAVRSPGTGRRDRVDHLLHIAMAVVMAVMPWSPGLPLSGRGMTLLFTAAAAWFPLTALRRRAAATAGAAAIAGRLPPAAGMAAMAWQSHVHHGSAIGSAVLSHETLAGGVPAAHHVATLGHAGGAAPAADVVTGLLAAYLLVQGIRALNPLPPLWPAATTAHPAAATGDPYGHLRDGAMALGTAVMLLMSH